MPSLGIGGNSLAGNINLDYLIWSWEHDAWWKSEHKGYTKNRDEAGLYQLGDALRICKEANRHLAKNMPPNESVCQRF